jgi:urease accessory protein
VATLVLLNPTGGLLGGDVLETSVRLGAGSRVCLTTPSATRVYRCPGAPAVQRLVADVGPGAALEWLPDHVIPSPGARLRQAAEIALGPGAALLFLDAWASGRAARREAWSFDFLDSGLEVRDAGGLVLKERCVLDAVRAGQGLGGTEGFPYIATFAALAPHLAGWEALVRELQAELDAVAPDARAGVMPLARGGLLARVLCPSAPRLGACVLAMWARCRRRVLGLEPAALRKL